MMYSLQPEVEQGGVGCASWSDQFSWMEACWLWKMFWLVSLRKQAQMIKYALKKSEDR